MAHMKKNLKSQISNLKFYRGFTKQQRSMAGFTLVEMLVAVSIFSVVVVVSTDVFIRAQRVQRQSSALEKVQDITRFLLTRIVQEIQSGFIDYAYYANSLSADAKTIISGTEITSETLALKNSEGQTMLFTVRRMGHTDFGGLCGAEKTSPCLIIAEVSPGTRHERATQDGYTIQKLAFVITPRVDSLHIDTAKNDYPSDIQPKVTIMLSVRGDVPGLREPIVLAVQTTVSSREYIR